MKHYRVTCDSCNADVTDTSNCVGYRIAVTVERLASRSNVVTVLMVDPPLPRDYHFCGRTCLRQFLTELLREDRQRAGLPPTPTSDSGGTVE